MENTKKVAHLLSASLIVSVLVVSIPTENITLTSHPAAVHSGGRVQIIHDVLQLDTVSLDTWPLVRRRQQDLANNTMHNQIQFPAGPHPKTADPNVDWRERQHVTYHGRHDQSQHDDDDQQRDENATPVALTRTSRHQLRRRSAENTREKSKCVPTQVRNQYRGHGVDGKCAFN